MALRWPGFSMGWAWGEGGTGHLTSRWCQSWELQGGPETAANCLPACASASHIHTNTVQMGDMNCPQDFWWKLLPRWDEGGPFHPKKDRAQKHSEVHLRLLQAPSSREQQSPWYFCNKPWGAYTHTHIHTHHLLKDHTIDRFFYILSGPMLKPKEGWCSQWFVDKARGK